MALAKGHSSKTISQVSDIRTIGPLVLEVFQKSETLKNAVWCIDSSLLEMYGILIVQYVVFEFAIDVILDSDSQFLFAQCRENMFKYISNKNKKKNTRPLESLYGVGIILKPQGLSKSNFMWNLSGIGKQKFISIVHVTLPRWHA